MNIKLLTLSLMVCCITLYLLNIQIKAKEIQEDSEVVLQSSNTDLDLNFNASVATLYNLTINSVATQSDGKVIIGGNFSLGGETPHNGLARLDSQGGIDSTFNGGTGTNGQIQEVYAVAVQSDGKILVGGHFETFNGQAIRYLARLNSDGSLDNTFKVGSGTFGDVRSIAVQPDGKILVGGDFVQINGVSTNRVARLNADGSVDNSFRVEGTGPSHSVYSINFQSNGKVLIGGIFTNYNNNFSHAYFLRLNSDGTLDNTFNIGTGVGGRVYSIYVQTDDKILIGGYFLSFNGTPHNNVARLNVDGSLDTNFNPIITTDVYSIVSQPDGKVLVGGNFNQVNGGTRNSIARLNLDGSLDSTYVAGVSFKVNSISLQVDGKAVAGGDFSAANGVPRSAVARFDSSGNLDNSFDPIIGSAGTVQTISVYPDGKVLIGGIFNSVNSVRKNQLARLNTDGSVDTSFDTGTGANDNILATAIQTDGKILVGGDFNQFNGASQSSIARLNSNGTIDNSFNLPGGISSRVRAIKIQSDGKILVGGGFIIVGGSLRNHIARLNADGSLDTTFNATADQDVYDIAEQKDGKILVAGSFSRVNNTNQVGIARLNADGTLDTTFNTGTGAGGQIFSIALQPNGKIIIGGFFTAFNNVQRNYVARLNTDGSLDTSFDPGSGADFTVFSVTTQPDGKIIIGGNFYGVNGQVHEGLVRLMSNGAVDNSFNYVISRNGYNKPTVLKIVLTENANKDGYGNLIVGGQFTNVNGYSRIGLARFNLHFNFGSINYDFDGDGKADISVFRPDSGIWYLLNSTSGFTAMQFGVSTDKLVPADYDGDGKTDVAVFRDGTWYLQRSSLGFTGIVFGQAGDIPVPADFDGDGKAEIAVWRPSNGTWYIYNLVTNQFSAVQFGQTGDIPVVGDYDGDGKADVSVYRPSQGIWYLNRSQLGFTGVQFGAPTDKPVPADYDGDGKTDVAVFRPNNGTWYLQQSTAGFAGMQFGISTDKPVPADYDGDGKADIAVFRDGTWYLNRSTAGFTGVAFGASTDKPVPNAFVP